MNDPIHQNRTGNHPAVVKLLESLPNLREQLHLARMIDSFPGHSQSPEQV